MYKRQHLSRDINCRGRVKSPLREWYWLCFLNFCSFRAFFATIGPLSLSDSPKQWSVRRTTTKMSLQHPPRKSLWRRASLLITILLVLLPCFATCIDDFERFLEKEELRDAVDIFLNGPSVGTLRHRHLKDDPVSEDDITSEAPVIAPTLKLSYEELLETYGPCLLYTSPSPRD